MHSFKRRIARVLLLGCKYSLCSSYWLWQGPLCMCHFVEQHLLYTFPAPFIFQGFVPWTSFRLINPWSYSVIKLYYLSKGHILALAVFQWYLQIFFCVLHFTVFRGDLKVFILWRLSLQLTCFIWRIVEDIFS